MQRLIWVLGLIGWAGQVAAAEITVFAASSLKPALEEVAARWALHSGNTARLSFGSSAALAQQIEAGAPADLFVSAAENWMDYLQDRERIVSASRVDLWGNGLSLIAHDGAEMPFVLVAGGDLAGRIGGERLAMALVDSVPVGQYGKQALVGLGLWQAVLPQVVQTQDARATLALVASGEAAYGVVYTTDAQAAEAEGLAIEIGRFPETSHDPVRYPGAVIAGENEAVAQAFLDYLAGPDAALVFAAQGYEILTDD